MPGLKWPAANTQKAPGVAVEGGSTKNELPPLNRYGPTRWAEIFSASNSTASFTVTSDSWIIASPSNGTIKSAGDTADQRIVFSVDWLSAPAGKSTSTIKIIAGTTTVSLTVSVDSTQVPSNFSGFVENDRIISIEPEHYTTSTSSSTASYGIIPSYGRSLSGVTLFPVTTTSQTPLNSPRLAYNIYTFTATTASITLYLSPSLNTDPSRPLTYYISVDDATPTKAQYIPITKLGTLPSTWMESTKNAAATFTTKHVVGVGAHVLNLWAGEPGVVFQKVVIDLGGVRSSYLGPPESMRVGI